MGDGWRVSRAGQVFGPYSWERVLELAREGSIGADDLIMRPGSDEWARADTVPAFTAPAAAAPAVVVSPAVPAAPAAPAVPAAPTPPVEVAPDMPTEAPAPASPPAAAPAESVGASTPAAPAGPTQDLAPSDSEVPERAPRKRPSKRTVLKVGAAVAVVLAVGAGVWLLPDVLRDRGSIIPPKAGNVIDTESAGRVQRNRIVVGLKDGATKADAERLANQLKGIIVGRWENLGFYTIEFPSTTEAELATALKTASEAKGIASAHPDRVPKP